MSSKELRRWSDDAMFRSEDLDARSGPTATVLQMNSDPLGSIAAATLMYKGIVIRDLADVTDEQRRECWDQINTTKLKAPFEFVDLHILLEGVTRSFTHQAVRQRTATFTQESLRFAVVEDNFADRVALPPSLMGTTAVWRQHEDAAVEFFKDKEPGDQNVDGHVAEMMTREPAAEVQRWAWDKANDQIEAKYSYLVNSGMPAEDARGLLPHNITTRYHWRTDLRALQDHGGNRLCTQAQFEWRAVWIRIVEAIRAYGRRQTYAAGYEDGRSPTTHSSQWQFNLIADMFRPVCYLTGKCEFAAMDLDRKCSIRGRVDEFHAAGVPSSGWESPHHQATGTPVGEQPRLILPIHPREWLADPTAAR